MKFLEAKSILAAFEGGEKLPFLLGMSGQPEPLEVFLGAAAAERGYEADVRTLPFNTLAQTLYTPAESDGVEVFLLFPWDLVPVADWRSGVPTEPSTLDSLVAQAHEVPERLRSRPNARCIYVDAPVPALTLSVHDGRSLRSYLRGIMTSLGADIVESSAISFDSLFMHGNPLATASLGDIARTIVRLATRTTPVVQKVLITDFDNTLWRGVVGEDGVEGVHAGPTGLGFPHFVYQTFLQRLRSSGVLLVGVTRNDPDLALAPLQDESSVIQPEDFVSVLASYNPKSTQIEQLAGELNLGLDSFVFVDDNPVEIAEVGGALPAVTCVQFPARMDGLAGLIDRLAELFHRERLTDEDRDRTEMYRTRLAGMVPKDAGGSDLRGFLSSLQMKLVIHDRSSGGRDRAVQLINKTNQFNLNGIRRTEDEVAEILGSGGSLYTAALADRHGSHGEILSCLLDGEGVVRSLVMSCRVFQREVETAFFCWLHDVQGGAVALEYSVTERNEPIRRFLRHDAFSQDGESWSADLGSFSSAESEALGLFDLTVPDRK